MFVYASVRSFTQSVVQATHINGAALRARVTGAGGTAVNRRGQRRSRRSRGRGHAALSLELAERWGLR